jgi:hypothetical protein
MNGNTVSVEVRIGLFNIDHGGDHDDPNIPSAEELN